MLLEEGASASVPHRLDPAVAEAQWRLYSWGSEMDLSEGFDKGPALSLPSPGRSSVLSQGLKAHTVVSSTQSEAPALQLSSSDVISVDAGDEDSPSHSPAY